MKIKKLLKYLPITVMTAGLAVAATTPSLSLLNNSDYLKDQIFSSNSQVDEVDYTDQFQYIKNDVEKQDGVTNSVASIKLAENSTSTDHSAAFVTKTDGSTLLYMWGQNNWGQLGNSASDTSTPTLVPSEHFDNKKIKQVSLGYFHSSALTEDGSLYMWGYNEYGELGFEKNYDANPIPTLVADFSDQKVTQVALGFNNSAAILKDGSLYMWGKNNYGQLANGTWVDTHIPSKVVIDSASPFVQVVLSYEHYAALLEDGSLYMWGLNDYGQLGNGGTANTSAPTLVTDLSDRKVTQIAIGYNHSAALLEDGTLYMWGFNDGGQLGNSPGDKDVPTLVTIPDSSSKIINIVLGQLHSAALLEDGSLYTWGDNSSGQLGISPKDQSIPNLVTIPNYHSKITQMALGSSHSAAILDDGSLYMWGDNYYGQIGNSTSGATPTRMSRIGAPSNITANPTLTAKEAVDSFWVDDNFNVDGFKKSFNLINIPETNQVITLVTEPKHDNATGTVTMNVKIKYFYNENGLPVTDTAAEEMTITGFALPAVVEDQKPTIEDQFPWWWIVIGASAAVLIALVAMFIIKKHNEEAVESVVSGPEFE